MASTINLLVLSKGLFEGNDVCNFLFGTNTFSLTTSEPETRDIILGGENINVTKMPLMVGKEDENHIVKMARGSIGNKSFDAAVVVLGLPIRATPEAEQYLRITRKIIGKQHLQTNTVLLFINGKDLSQQKFHEYLSGEVSSAKKRRDASDAIGTLIRMVHGNGDCNLRSFTYPNCQLLYDNIDKDEQCDTLLEKAWGFEPVIFSSKKTNQIGVLPIVTIGIIAALILICCNWLVTKKDNQHICMEELYVCKSSNEQTITQKQLLIDGYMQTILNHEKKLEQQTKELEQKGTENTQLKKENKECNDKLKNLDKEYNDYKKTVKERLNELSIL